MQPSAGIDPQRAEDEAAVRDNGVITIGITSVAIHDDEVRVSGERLMKLPEIQRMLGIFEMVLSHRGRLFLLFVAGKSSGTPNPETRRYLAEWGRRNNVNGTALVGGSTLTRTVVTLTVRAVSLLRRNPLPLIFVETEAEARTWFDELRTKAASAP